MIRGCRLSIDAPPIHLGRHGPRAGASGATICRPSRRALVRTSLGYQTPMTIRPVPKRSAPPPRASSCCLSPPPRPIGARIEIRGTQKPVSRKTSGRILPFFVAYPVQAWALDVPPEGSHALWPMLGRFQCLARLQEAFQARQNHWPAVGHARDEFRFRFIDLMRDRELHHVALRLEFEDAT